MANVRPRAAGQNAGFGGLFSGSGAVISAANLAESVVEGGGAVVINCEVVNDDSSDALTDVILQIQDHPDGEFYNYLSGSDWASTTNGNMRFATSGLNTLAASSVGHFIARVSGCHAFRVRLTASGTITSATVRGVVAAGG